MIDQVMKAGMVLGLLWTSVVYAGEAVMPSSIPDPSGKISTQVSSPEVEGRALWVTRWDYKSPDDVRKIMANAARLHFNQVLFQVRGNATVFYRSRIEPWAWELTGNGPETTGKDPGWDPLALACNEAHRLGLELHAYMNVFPAWRSRNYPPPGVGQLWNTHPEWFMVNCAGQKMIPRPNWYAFISPGIPEVQDYLARVFEEVAANYPIDGIHFDYIRYPAEIHEVDEAFREREKRLGNWSYDPVSLRRFTEETGVARPDDDPEAWTRWRGEQVTATLRKIAQAVRAHKPDIILSAAVSADPEHGRNYLMQPSADWLNQGLIDIAVTMNYTKDNDKFLDRCRKFIVAREGCGLLYPGLSFGNSAEQIEQQIAIVRGLPVEGFAGFAYSHLFDRNSGHMAKPKAAELLSGPLAQAATAPKIKRRLSNKKPCNPSP